MFDVQKAIDVCKTTSTPQRCEKDITASKKTPKRMGILEQHEGNEVF